MRSFASILGLCPVLSLAYIKILDPMDSLPADYFAADNAVPPNLTGNFFTAVSSDATANFFGPDTNATYSHVIWETQENLTHAAYAVNGTTLRASYTTVVKTGYSGDVWSSELNGVNSALSFAGKSKGSCNNCNLTTHNGAIGAFATNGSTLNLSSTSIYTTGPAAHAVWSSMGSNVSGNGLQVSTAGLRSGAFGAGPQGTVNSQGSVIHTTGPWSSPLFYGVGEDGFILSNKDVGNADGSPIAILDGSHYFQVDGSRLTGSGLAGILVTHTSAAPSTPVVVLSNAYLLNSGRGPAMWFGNCIASVKILATSLIAVTGDGSSGILMIANNSQTSPAYDQYTIVSPPNSTMRPARVTANIQSTQLIGDIHAVGGAVINLWLEATTRWFGSTYIPDASYTVSSINVFIDSSSLWSVTGHDAVVRELILKTNLSCIFDNGFNIYYDGLVNSWLQNQTRDLQNGGRLIPYYPVPVSVPPSVPDSSVPEPSVPQPSASEPAVPVPSISVPSVPSPSV